MKNDVIKPRQLRWQEKQKALGLVKVALYVPLERRAELQQIAHKMRKEHSHAL